MKFEDRPLCFDCQGQLLYGILSLPQRPLARAVVIVVGGPQTRVGSHRQFVLLARDLASHGYPVLRFDYRGMGDSEGEPRNFEGVQEDLRAAIDQLLAAASMVREVVLWGLCDGASAAMLYAYQDPRITGLVLANPWVHTEEGEAKARLKHYYRARLFQPAFWQKIWRGDFDFIAAAESLWTMLRRAIGHVDSAGQAAVAASLPARLYHGFHLFTGQVLIILSGNDLTAQEFQQLVHHCPKWRNVLCMPRVRQLTLPQANHTFSRQDWHRQVINQTKTWLNDL